MMAITNPFSNVVCEKFSTPVLTILYRVVKVSQPVLSADIVFEITMSEGDWVPGHLIQFLEARLELRKERLHHPIFVGNEQVIYLLTSDVVVTIGVQFA